MADRSRATTNGNGVSRTRNGASSAGVRRNLFQSQLTRRPTAGSTSTSAETLHLDVDVLSDTSEIVVRDKNGEIELGNPPTPMMDDEDELPLDNAQECESMQSPFSDINRHDVHEQPEELIEAVRASLRAKVAALSEDNWMFEPEEQHRG
ncbi:hypothetical protein FSHL1_001712 [Fusarium sambucinum]